MSRGIQNPFPPSGEATALYAYEAPTLLAAPVNIPTFMTTVSGTSQISGIADDIAAGAKRGVQPFQAHQPLTRAQKLANALKVTTTWWCASTTPGIVVFLSMTSERHFKLDGCEHISHYSVGY